MSRLNAVALGAALLVGFAGAAGITIAQAPGTKAPGMKTQGDRRGPGIEGRRGFGGRFGRGFGGSFVKDLNLTDAQKAQIKSIHEKYRPQLEAIRGQVKAQADNARALRAKGDTAGARAAFQKTRADIRQRMLTIRQQEQAEVRGILTPEQRAKFDAAQAQRKKWMEDHAKDGRGNFGRGTPPKRG